jgi:signal transduction histidine kinase
MKNPLAHLSLLSKIMLSTSIAITLLFAVTGWIVQRQFFRSASQTLEEEVQGSFKSYESLWQARADQLSAVSMVLSRMSDVRAAFGTHDHLTIRDTAEEIWRKIAADDAVFLVTDPRGAMIASLGGYPGGRPGEMEIVRQAAQKFPKQSVGFSCENRQLYQLVVTPVYVDAAGGSALLNVLVAGFAVNEGLARDLKDAAAGSDFAFLCGGQIVASTIPGEYQRISIASEEGMPRVLIEGIEYAQFSTPLSDLNGQAIGELRILRSFDSINKRSTILRHNMIAAWMTAVVAGLLLTYGMARRIVRPVEELDVAATEIAKGNYEAKVEVHGQDELGRLAQTFNAMCHSIRTARDEVIRQERLATISRLSTSIVHDLRNPLASIYGGAEMLVDDDLPPQQVKRLAANIYRSSVRVKDLLNDLSDITRGRTYAAERCRLIDVVSAASEIVSNVANRNNVVIDVELSPDLEVNLQRSRMERVFENLLLNAVEAMPEGGKISVAAQRRNGEILVSVEDNGPGISPAVAQHLFEPFVSHGKTKGIGLGLALSRQTVRDHGGDLSADPRPRRGACFLIRLPV